MKTLHLSGNSSTPTSIPIPIPIPIPTSTPDDFYPTFIKGISNLSPSEKRSLIERQYTGANSEDASSLREYLTDNLELY